MEEQIRASQEVPDQEPAQREPVHRSGFADLVEAVQVRMAFRYMCFTEKLVHNAIPKFDFFRA